MKPGMRSTRIVVLLALMSVMVLLAKAQSHLVFYHLNDQFNASGYNPAFLTSQKNFTFSIFPMTGMSVGYNNHTIIREMLTNVLRGDTIKNTLSDVFNSLVKRGLFYQRFESSLLNFGYNSDFGSFNFRINEVEQLMSNFKGDFSEFITNPKFQTLTINQPQPFPAYGVYYREYSLGYANEIIKDKLSIGIRAKLYFGKFSALSEVQGELVKKSSAFYLQTKGSVKLSVPLKVVQNSDSIFIGANLSDNFTPGNFLMNSKNIGTGIDFGINYKFNPRIAVSASVVDLGRINWKNNLNVINYKGKYEFPMEFADAAGEDFLTKNPSFSTDTTVVVFDLFKAAFDEKTFLTPLPVTFYIGLQYHLNPDLNIGVVDRYISIKGMSYNSFSLTANYEVNKKLSISSGYSMIGNSFFNIPLAMLYKWDSGQAYIGSDNVFSFLFPSFSDFSGIAFGTCFYLFRGKTRDLKQLEYLPFYQPKKTRQITKTD